MDGRAAYQLRRFSILSSSVDIGNSLGLEIGAADLPTVSRQSGQCRYADFRTADEMASLWNIPRNTVCHVDYVLDRQRPISGQIEDKFDYIVACHVLEHVPDLISYVNELRTLLKPEPGNVLFFTLPDKRATPDRLRTSTTVERLLAYYHDRVRYPLFDHILEHYRHWVAGVDSSLSTAFAFAADNVKSGQADAHCHVWEDREFLAECEELIGSGFLPGLQLAHFEPFFDGTNEFAVVLKTT